MTFPNAPWFRPNVTAVIIAMTVVVFLGGHYEIDVTVVMAAMNGLSGLGGYLLGRGE